MYINKNFLEFMFSGKMHYKGALDDYFIVKEPQGVLVVTKGRMVMADPYAINYGAVITEDIPNGKFPVSTFTVHLEPHDEVRVAGFLVQFVENEDEEPIVPDEWKMCLPADIDAREIPDDGFYGVSTESGNVAICAEQTVGWLLEHLEDSAHVLEDIEKQLSATYFANGGVANAKLPGIDANVFVIVGGESGQAYPAYWGYKDGQVVCMAIDFLAVD